MSTTLIGAGPILIYCSDDARETWGWWCRESSTPTRVIAQDDYVSKEKAQRSARKHCDRRGHR